MKTRDALLEPGNSIGYRGGDNQLVSTTWRRYTQAEIYCIGVFVYLYLREEKKLESTSINGANTQRQRIISEM